MDSRQRDSQQKGKPSPKGLRKKAGHKKTGCMENGCTETQYMESQKLKSQVELIRQAFGYVDQFKGKTFVIKIASQIIQSSLFPILVKDLVHLHKMGIMIVLVPGSRERIDSILDQYGIQWRKVEGIRVSPPSSMPFIKMAAFDVSNQLMTALSENDTNAVIGNWVRARGIGIRKGIDFQSTGMVDKLKINIIQNVLQQDLIPIFPNIGWNARGMPYNISSNELATRLSWELSAEKLFFVTDKGCIKSGDYTIPDGVETQENGVVSRFTVAEAGELLSLNEKRKDMTLSALVNMAIDACERGVRRVHIVDGQVEGVILKEIFSNRGFGTMIYADEYANIRPMVHEDIPEVLGIMQPLVEKDVLIHRNARMLEDTIEDFIVYEVDGTIHACGALRVFDKKKGEIAGIAVDETYSNLGIGKKVVTYLQERARQLGLEQVFVLTTQSFDWFFQLGFVQGEREQLPEDRRSGYDTRRNSSVLFYNLDTPGDK
jgi:amino-acid N-acetyltransferase